MSAQRDLGRVSIARPVMNVNFHRVVMLGETDLRCSIEPQGKVDGIPDANEGRVNLVGPDFEKSKLRLAVDRGKRCVHCIEPMGDFDAADAGDVEARIEDAPLMLKVNLEIGMEIHGSSGIQAADIWQVTGHVAGGKVERPAECNRDVRKVAADSKATSDDFRGRQVRSARAGNVADVSLDPVANGDDLVDAIDEIAELLRGQGEEFIRIAVTTRKGVANGVRRDLPNRNRELFEIRIVRQRGDLHHGVVDN